VGKIAKGESSLVAGLGHFKRVHSPPQPVFAIRTDANQEDPCTERVDVAPATNIRKTNRSEALRYCVGALSILFAIDSAPLVPSAAFSSDTAA
jgi:hypothetical protein